MPRSALIFIFLFLPLQPETERRLLYNRKLSEEEIKNFRLMAAVGTGSKHAGNDGTKSRVRRCNKELITEANV